MNKTDTAIGLILMLMIGLYLGYIVGNAAGRVAVMEQALEAGAAYYTHEPNKSQGIFTWKENK